jgi:GINS complex subunit 3
MADYFNLDAILAEEERVQVRFAVGSTGLGRAIDPSCDDDDLKTGSEVELPFWLLRDLAIRGFVSLQRPKFFSVKTKNDLDADSRCVNLGEKCPYFYQLGLNILSMTNQAWLSEYIKATFEKRYSQLLIQAMSVQPDTRELVQIQRVLTREEDTIFEAGRQMRMAIGQWESSLMPGLLKAPKALKRKKPPAAAEAPRRAPLSVRN